ncbi:MAG: hypothetical protein JWQ81_3627 [Amycolatopsis sp.]|uniref:WXG100 family type VII secretion target n=1 Tax=Amycolatopsis sp. TaxID=37632 RepID=UPI00262E3F7B|nr:hypothetical protein [Amycolatopsis sp.]MCU1682888.1 hypothetical protein [Amycolatopsis sp.]
MSQLDLTADNSTAGLGVADSWHSVATSIEALKTAHGGDRAAVAVEIGVTVASGVLDTVAFVLDPLAKLISAGLGWLIEHVRFLRWPLDQVAGNPDQIKVIATQLHTIGENLRNAATDLDSALKADLPTWKGQAADQFTAAMNGHKTHIDDSGHAVDVAGYVVETTMALIAAVRALFRDIITTILGDIISTMLIALATAPLTFGASIVAGVAEVITVVSVQVASMLAKLAKALGLAGRSAGRLHDLGDLTHGESTAGGHALGDLPPRPANPTPPHTPEPTPHTPTDDTPPATHDDTPPPAHNDDGYGPQQDIYNEYHDGPSSSNSSTHSEDGYGPQQDIYDEYHNTPGGDGTSTHSSDAGGPSVHGEPAPTPTPTPTPTPPPSVHDEPAVAAPDPKPTGPVSVLKDQDIAKLKAHEDWLKKVYEGPQNKAKFVDNWIKKTYPDAYPYIKGMSDAKSSKNWVGWVDKNFVQVDKQLTGIQDQADKAWAQSDSQWREQHPDPAAP